jgi:uncharacterized repeat protein (TIGR03843 family)
LNVVTLAEVVGRMPYATNLTLLARDRDGRLWVYKPAAGETPLWDFPARSLAAREILTYEMAQALGFEVVPETIMADGPFGPGSAQRLIDEDREFDLRTLFTPVLDPRLWPIAALDIVVNNADRKAGHFIREKGSDRIWAIDNGLTFHVDDKLRTVLWGFAGQPLPAELMAGLSRLPPALERGLRSRVADLLSDEEAEALSLRVDRLLQTPVHPLPPDDRPPLPWPVW